MRIKQRIKGLFEQRRKQDPEAPLRRMPGIAIVSGPRTKEAIYRSMVTRKDVVSQRQSGFDKDKFED